MVKISKLEYEYTHDIFIVDESDIHYIKVGDIILDSKDIGMTTERLQDSISDLSIESQVRKCLYRKEIIEDTNTFRFLLEIWSDLRDIKLKELDLE